jgi:hypothetical protein
MIGRPRAGENSFPAIIRPVVRQNQIARTILTFNNLEGTISRHVRDST